MNFRTLPKIMELDRMEHVFESFSAWFQSPLSSVVSGLGRDFPSQKWLIVWKERRRKKLKTEESKWRVAMSTVVDRKVWPEGRFTDLPWTLYRQERRKEKMDLAFWQQCIVDENFPVQGFSYSWKKLGFMFLSCKDSREGGWLQSSEIWPGHYGHHGQK